MFEKTNPTVALDLLYMNMNIYMNMLYMNMYHANISNHN